jgi:multidrug efflux pump subunit AcrB
MKKLVAYFVKYPIWGNAIIVTMLTFGLVCYFFVIKRSFFPEIDPTTINITVAMPGAAPEEVEEGVTTKIEQSLKGIEGIKEITSNSSENFANITVQLLRGTDADKALADVKNAVDGISSFPATAERPIIAKIRPRSRGVNMALRGDVDLATLKKFAENIEDDLLNSSEISQVNIVGYPVREISIEVDEATLLRYNLRFDQIVSAVRLNNRDISAGAIKTLDEEILLRSRAKGKTPDEIGNIVLRANADGSKVYLRDVATIVEQFADDPNALFMDGKRAVSFEITKLPEEDLQKISEYCNQYIEKFNLNNKEVELVMSFDSFSLLSQRLNMLIENGVMGLLLVLVCLGLFLSLRLSFWVAVGIPISFAGMLILAAIMGLTINMISLFGMILVVGILVDDGIVIGENIYAHIEKGKTPTQAAIDGTFEVMPSVFTSVLTTIVAFLPIGIGIEGFDFLQEMALVVIFCLAVSLVEAFFILPGHISEMEMNQKENRFRRTLNGSIEFLRCKMYAPILQAALKYKYIAAALPIVFAMVVLGMINGGLIRTTFFPNIPFDEFQVNLAFKAGTPKEKVQAYLEKYQKIAWELNQELKAEYKDDKDFFSHIFLIIGKTADGSETGSHAGHLSIALQEMDRRAIRSEEIANRLREKIGKVPEAEKFIVGGASRFGKPVSIRLMSKDISVLNQAKEQVKAELEKYAALKDIADNLRAGRRELQIELKPEAYFLGLTHADITNQIRQGFFGEEIQRLQKGIDEIRVWARYPENSRNTIGQLENMRIKTADGREFPLTQLATYSIERGITDIRHYNGAREVAVEADLADLKTSVPDIIAQLDSTILRDLRQKYPSLRIEFGGQQQRSRDSQASLIFTLPIAVFIIILLVTLTFRSLPQALMIVGVLVPLGFFSAALGHFFHPTHQISLLSFWGILALSGVIINDAVVFVDRFNAYLREGNSLVDSAYLAGMARFRAILLTSITTIAGLAPLILEKSFQAQFLIPMAISVAYGVGIGTIITLVIFPALVAVINDLRRFLVWLPRYYKHLLLPQNYKDAFPTAEEVEPAVREMKRLQKEKAIRKLLP